MPLKYVTPIGSINVHGTKGSNMTPILPTRPAVLLRCLGLTILIVAASGCGDNPQTADDKAALQSKSAGEPGTAQPPGCTPAPPDAILPSQRESGYTTLCWGTVGWREPTLNGKALQQQLDVYPARIASSAGAPLVVWAHPNGMSKTITPGDPYHEALVRPALEAGYAFASVEFRHPVVNAPSEPDQPVPHTDLGEALNYLTAHAQALNIDPKNIFLAGQSRGTLGVWTAMQTKAPAPWPKVRAVFGYNAQTSYDGNEFAEWFLVESDRAKFLKAFNEQNPNAERYGSAVRDVSADAPPVQLRYSEPVVEGLISLKDLRQHDPLHYPNFGRVLCEAYARAQAPEGNCQYMADARINSVARGFYGYISFFNHHRSY